MYSIYRAEAAKACRTVSAVVEGEEPTENIH